MNKKSKNALLLVVLLAIVGIAVGYAALSQSLVLNGTATVKGSSDFDVHFVKDTATATNGVGSEDAAITIDDAELTGTFSATFEPGGVATYVVEIVNDGTIEAAKDGEATVDMSGDVADLVTCTVEETAVEGNLKKDDGKHTYTITLKCAEATDGVDFPEATATAEATVTFNYIQASAQTSGGTN